MKNFTEFTAELDEAISVEHDRYVRSHGKKATGSGNWMFTHKRSGDVDHKDNKEVHHANGSFSDAAKSAKQWAKSHGHSAVYVMEEVEAMQEELHRVNVSLSDPNHQMASQRKEKIQKIVKLKALDKEHALSKAKQYYKDRGYKVHDAEHVGVVNEEVVAEGSGPKEKQKTPYRNINSPEYKAAADKQRQQMAKDKAAEPGKKMLAKLAKEEVELDEANISTAPVKKVGFNDIVVRKHPSGHHVVVRKGGAYTHLKKGEKLTHKDMKDMASNRAKFHLEESEDTKQSLFSFKDFISE